MKRTVFEVAYEGPAVDGGSMDVRELAPALLALGNLIENANRVAGDTEAKIKVVVRSDFKEGSFQVALELLYSLSEQIRLLFDLQKTDNLAEKLLYLTGFTACTGVTLLKLMKWLKGRPIKNATVLENGNTRLELSGENGQFEYIEADDKVIRLYRDRAVRENLRKVLSPLDKEGIDGFSVRKGKDVVESISKNEVPYYDVLDAKEEQSKVFVRNAYVSLIEIAFEEGLKWRLSDGDNKFYAVMADNNFLGQMDTGKTFTKGDVLEVEMETTQTATLKGIKNEHRVLKVINHLSRSQQLPLLFSPDDNNE